MIEEGAALPLPVHPPDAPKPYASGYRVTYDDMMLTFTGIRDGSEGIHAETSLWNGKGRRLHRDLKLNIGSNRTLSSFARKCSEYDPTKPWDSILDIAVGQVIDAFREGTPLESLAVAPTHTSTPYLLWPVLSLDQITILFADKASMKSYLAAAMCMAVQAAVPLPAPLEAKSMGRTAIYDWETDVDTHRRRARRLAMGWGIPTPDILYRRMERRIEDALPVILRDVEEHDLRLVVIDSVGFAAGGDILQAKVATETMNAIRRIPCTKLVTAHISSQETREENGDSVPFGSRFFFFAARAAWRVKRVKRTIGLYPRAANDEAEDGPGQQPIGLSLEFEGRDGPVTLMGARLDHQPEFATIDKQKSKRELIYELLYEEGPRSCKELGVALGIPEGTVRPLVNSDTRLIRLGTSQGRNSNKWKVRGE